jgi:osmotically-inducible protein OsmY
MPTPLFQAEVENGIVTLRGQVNRGSERVRATELAELTRGVRAVVNRLSVKSSDAQKSDLERDIRSALLDESAEEYANVRVAVDGSHVTLTGFVPHAQAKETAENTAWFVTGVTGVDNRISVTPGAARSDREIAADVERNLRTDAYVVRAPLQASVEHGRVRLSGRVQSAFEKRRAHTRALVAGVTEVQDEDIRVLPKPEWSTSYAAAPPTDVEAVAAIRDAFRADPRVPAETVDFSVKYGVVTLTGFVRTLAQKLAAAEDARNAVGTWAVLNQLEVRAGTAISHENVQERVLARLRGNPSVNAERITVEAREGAVVLAGEVASTFERAAAERATAGVPGVTSVENRLSIGTSQKNLRTDAELEDQIELALRWDPRVGADSIDVSVQAGVVTLRGEVANPEVHNAVLENVFQSAPRGLVDELWWRKPARFLYSD